jgi:hypothetical protein
MCDYLISQSVPLLGLDFGALALLLDARDDLVEPEQLQVYNTYIEKLY